MLNPKPNLSSSRTNPTTVTGRALRQWRERAIAQATTATLDPQEVDWLLRELAQVDRLQLRWVEDEEPIAMATALEHLDRLWEKRLGDRTPLQYLVGHTPWREFQLQVGPGVLIPRPETELLIDLVGERFGPETTGNWADLGTGTGAIALGLAVMLPEIQVHAVDCSPEALAIARANFERYAVTAARTNVVPRVLRDRVRFYQGDWFEPLEALRGQIQGMISNPPYIPQDLLPMLQPEVYRHEPHLALDGGADGLDSLRHLVNAGAEFLAPGGFWAVELMAGQAPQVEALLHSQGQYEGIERMQDLAGIERFVVAYRRLAP